MHRLRLLIVDENPSVRQALATRLSTQPELEVLTGAGSVEEVTAVINQSLPDIVLIEPKRLDGAGYFLIQTMMETPRPPVIIVLTSFHDDNEELLTTELGSACYLLKEIDSQALIDTILACHPGPEL